jgi:hypothetical protein
MAHADDATVECSEEGDASVTFSGTLSTTGSVDSAVITAAVDGDEESEVGVIQPQHFVHDGQDKTAAWSFAIDLADGEHSVEVCFTQSGAQGRPPKTVCATVEVEVSCGGECEIGACVSDCQHDCNELDGPAKAACNQCCECKCKSEIEGCTPQDLCYTGSPGHAVCLTAE